MTERIIPIADSRGKLIPAVPPLIVPPIGLLIDRRDRPLHDLRISVTDRCNFRCTYCMPKQVFNRDHPFLPHEALLRFEEIQRLARIAVAHGVQKIRLTGGEPLLRRGIENLVELLADLRTPNGLPVDLTLTTNGSLLTRKARVLAQAGLQRVTVSLDAIDDAVFRRMNDVDYPVADVLAGIDAAHAAGLAPIKVNMVVRRGINDDQVVAMARHFRHGGCILRFIEFMDVGVSNGWRMDEVVPSAEIISKIDRVYPVEAVDPNYPGEVAARWRYRDGGGEIGVISSVTRAFCADCTRARLSTDGKLYLCLFAARGYDFRALLRGGLNDAQISGALAQLWQQRNDRYSELRGATTQDATRIEMSYIGG